MVVPYKRPGLRPNHVDRDGAPHLTMDDIEAAGGYDQAADRWATAWEYRLFVMRRSGAETVVEVIPTAVRAAHGGPFRAGWAPCPCGDAGGGHRRLDLDCCATTIALGCTVTPIPPPCRDAVIPDHPTGPDLDGSVRRGDPTA